MKTYAYCRVSTVDQRDTGESLGVQQRQIEAYATMRGLSIDRVFVDGAVSGGKPLHKRPEGGEMLAAIQAGDAVIVTKVDRIGRGASDSLNVCEDFIKRDISLHIIQMGDDVTRGIMAKAMYQIWCVFAELEREQIRSRIKDCKADQRKRGRFLGGGVAFGKRKGVDGGLVPHEAEQAAIKQMVDMRNSGESLRRISGLMGNCGYKLSHQAVARILRDI